MSSTLLTQINAIKALRSKAQATAKRTSRGQALDNSQDISEFNKNGQPNDLLEEILKIKAENRKILRERLATLKKTDTKRARRAKIIATTNVEDEIAQSEQRSREEERADRGENL